MSGIISESDIWTLPLDEPEDICIDETHGQIEVTTINECAAKCSGITNLFQTMYRDDEHLGLASFLLNEKTLLGAL